ncbi:hypothetical protein SLEP1_g46565 [Rubroshorea leprosula]|uniref:Leucine-rich repeat-containing N-terminal plant-type domain-containing protein n=1 Tax=Rubroshorea leprosula TaxID=152421 RepID=A0AAV5LMQ7_9ROSI|nr:hypothetical protein SLEP1_g46565 [Rubroshorea leprosula]
MHSTLLCLLFFFLYLKTAFSSSLHASSFSTTHLCSHEEALALLQFKTSFSINYTVPSPDFCVDLSYTKPNYSKIESWKEGIDCCSWDGVSCDNVTGHVIALNLSCSFLHGTFPSNSTLFFLRNLQSLNLALNDFRLSKIPSKINQFTRLKHLDISYSRFSGHVPGEIAHLPKLVSLNLSNHLYDDSPDLILETTTFRNLVHNLSEVRELVLRGVNMTSVNPRFFMNLSSSLTTLGLAYCQLRGNFPNSIFRFPNLKTFHLGGIENITIDLPSSNWSSPLQDLQLYVMDWGRRLPESIGDLKSLQVLFLGDNLEGSIPTSIGNLSQLTVLFLYHNNLKGQIPTSLANLAQLHSLYLPRNQFFGPIPAFLGNLSHLTSLDLNSNNLSGQIPSTLGNLTQLSSLDLSSNLLNGTMPPWIFTLPFVKSLYLNHNQFQGQISQFQQRSLIQLDLSNNKLQGPIPSSIVNFVNLSYLDLSSNHLSDLVVVSDMFLGLQNLETIILSYNNLSLRMSVYANFTLPKLTDVFLSSCNLSEFPNFLRHSGGLQNLVLSKNSINGNIPEWICEKDDLRILDLSHNNLIGKIPNCLPKFLSVLDLQANHFDGNIPFGFPEGCGLRNLNLYGNQMDGLLPRSLVNCSKLEVLDVGNNNIEDTFPHWLESLPDLQVLVLRSNKFHGSVQSTKESPSFLKLRVLDLSNNDFVGHLPVRYFENFKAMMDLYRDEGSAECKNVSSYQYSVVVTWKGFDYELQRILTLFSNIHLSNNKFEGEIPDVIGKLSSLKGLNLSHNNLTGHIPPSLGNLTNLESLDLSSNKLAGKIPNELGSQFNTFENGSYEGNLGLCGTPLSKSCDGMGTPPSSFQEKDELWRFGWRVVGLGYGCGVVFGLLMGYHVFRTGKPKCRAHLRSLSEEKNDLGGDQGERVLVVEGVVNAGYGVIEQWALLLRNAWPKVSMVLNIFKEKGVILIALLCLSAFFSWKRLYNYTVAMEVLDSEVHAAVLLFSCLVLRMILVRELAKKEFEDGVFQMLRSDVTQFLTTIVIGTTVVNIGAIALVTDATTAIFGEAGVSAATGVMTIVTLEDVVEEIVGEVFDENDSKEHQCEAVSGFVCEVFGYIPRAGGSIKVALKRVNQDDDDKHDEDGSDHQDVKEWHQIYRLEVLAANAQKVSAVRFEWTDNGEAMSEANKVTQLIPKIIKRKGNDDKLDNITYDENAFRKRQGNRLSDCYVVAEDT